MRMKKGKKKILIFSILGILGLLSLGLLFWNMRETESWKKGKQAIEEAVQLFAMKNTSEDASLQVEEEITSDAERFEEETVVEEGVEMTTSFDKFPLPYFSSSDLRIQFKNISVGTIEKFEGKWQETVGIYIKDKAPLKIERLEPGQTAEFVVKVSQKFPLILFIIGGSLVGILAILIVVIAFTGKKRKGRAYTAAVLAVLMVVNSTDVTALASENGVIIGNQTFKSISGISEEKTGVFTRQIESHHRKLKFSIETQFAYENRLTVSLSQDDTMIKMDWEEVNGAKEYRLLREQENGAHTVLRTVSDDETEILFQIEAGELYVCKIVAILDDEKVLMSESMNLLLTEAGEVFLDADGDILSDDLEQVFGTSVFLSDTDGDGISDMDEIAVSMTDPLLEDTDGDEIADGEEDSDLDNLTNKKEIQLKTHPYSDDTDEDGLKDGFEVNIFYSDPCIADTDKDELLDGDEYRLGTDPRSEDSNKNGISDAEDTLTVQLTGEESKTVLTLEASGAVAADAKIINQTDQVSFRNLDYIVSEIVNIQVDGEFQSAEISIPYGDDFAGEPKDLALCYYNPETGGFERLEEQSVDLEAGVIRAKTSHFSTFVLLYVPNWHKQFENPLAPERAAQTSVDVEFVIDESSSMEDNSKGVSNDPERWRVTASKNFVDALIEGDRVGVVGFSDQAERKLSLTGDLQSAKNAIDSITGNRGGTALYTGLEEALRELEEDNNGKNQEASEERLSFIIALTDGEDSNSAEERYKNLVETAKRLETPIFTIALGNSVNSGLLHYLSTATGGDYFHIDSADKLPQAFDRIVNNAVYGSDTDRDGLADLVEQHGLRDGKGNIYTTQWDNPDSDGDEIWDGDEAGDVYKSDSENENLQYYIMLSNPLKEDTDGDGLSDNQELELGTMTWCRDSDGDGLSDNQEVLSGFDPLNDNRDGDAYEDKDEFYDAAFAWNTLQYFERSERGSFSRVFYLLLDMALDRDPYTYDNSPVENLTAVLLGFLLGDVGETLKYVKILPESYVDSLYYMIGSFLLEFVPAIDKIGDIRDLIANLVNTGFNFATGDYGEAGINGIKVGINAIGVIPIVGDILDDTSSLLKKIEISMTVESQAAKVLFFVTNSLDSAAYTLKKSDACLKAVKNVVSKGLKNQTHRLGSRVIKLAEDFFGIEGISVHYADELLEAGKKSIRIAVNEESTGKSVEHAVRTAMGNKVNGKIANFTETKASGAIVTTVAYEKVRVLDLQCECYKKADAIENTLRHNLRNMSEFSGNKYIAEGFQKKVLDVAIPDTMISEEMKNALIKMQKEAENMGVVLRYRTYILEGRGDAETLVRLRGR